jgi:hypothetical protein
LLKQPVAGAILLAEQVEQIKVGPHHHKAPHKVTPAQAAHTVMEPPVVAAPELGQVVAAQAAGLEQVQVQAQVQVQVQVQEVVAVLEPAAVAVPPEAAQEDKNWQEDKVKENSMLKIKAHSLGLYFTSITNY